MPDRGDFEGILRRNGEQGKDRAPQGEQGSWRPGGLDKDSPWKERKRASPQQQTEGPAHERLSPAHTVEIVLVIESPLLKLWSHLIMLTFLQCKLFIF